MLCFSRMTDRNFDMPYIMLRGKNFFVTYGWSLNNVCQVSSLDGLCALCVTDTAVVARQFRQYKVHSCI